MVSLLTIFLVYQLKEFTETIEKANPGVIDKARMLLEFVRNGSLQVNLPCFESDVQFLICYLSTM